MRLDLAKLESEIAPLLEVHGVELVALEWMQGPGHGILRVTIDKPGRDPRDRDPETSVSLGEVTGVTRDVSTALDALDLIESAYTLEITSPGEERPVQKRADFDRFAGFAARIDVRPAPGAPRSHFTGTLRGTADLANDSWAVKIDVGGVVHDVARDRIARARLNEIARPAKPRPGKGPSRRQERLAERERARTINAAHLAAKSAAGTGAEPHGNRQDHHTDAPGASSKTDDAGRTLKTTKAER